MSSERQRAQMELCVFNNGLPDRLSGTSRHDKSGRLMHDNFLVAFEKIDQLQNPNGFGGWSNKSSTAKVYMK